MESWNVELLKKSVPGCMLVPTISSKLFHLQWVVLTHNTEIKSSDSCEVVPGQYWSNVQLMFDRCCHGGERDSDIVRFHKPTPSAPKSLVLSTQCHTSFMGNRYEGRHVETNSVPMDLWLPQSSLGSEPSGFTWIYSWNLVKEKSHFFHLLSCPMYCIGTIEDITAALLVIFLTVNHDFCYAKATPVYLFILFILHHDNSISGAAEQGR